MSDICLLADLRESAWAWREAWREHAATKPLWRARLGAVWCTVQGRAGAGTTQHFTQ